MGILKRLKTLFSAHANFLISKAEKTDKMLAQALIDMNEQLVNSKMLVAQAIADEKKLKSELEGYQAQVEEWDKKARSAITHGDDALAKEALLRKQDCETYVKEYEKQYLAQSKSIDTLKASLLDLSTKIKEAERKKTLLLARAKHAEAQTKIQETMNSLHGTSKSVSFGKFEDKVAEMEALVDAQKEVAQLDSSANLEQRFAALEQDSGDQLLANLKAEMNLIEDKT
jgi:phage shock protein A